MWFCHEQPRLLLFSVKKKKKMIIIEYFVWDEITKIEIEKKTLNENNFSRKKNYF